MLVIYYMEETPIRLCEYGILSDHFSSAAVKSFHIILSDKNDVASPAVSGEAFLFYRWE